MALQLNIDEEMFVMRGVRAGNGGQPARAFRQGRSCAHPECSTRLSIYNPTDLCWQHEPAHPFVNMAHRRAGDHLEREAS